MNREWNLLFGVLAAQLEKVAPDKLSAAAAAYMADPSVELPQRLADAGVLPESDRRLVAGLTDMAVQMHENDAAAALDALGGPDQALQLLGGDSGAAATDAAATAVKLVRGRTLRAALHEADSLTARLHLLPAFSNLCELLAGAHGQGAVHGNLNPDNVLISDFGEVVLLDWGLWTARKRRDATENVAREALRKEGAAPNSPTAATDPLYAAPESKTRAARLDARADVFSLGALLYEILTGRKPFVWREEKASSGVQIPEPIAALEPAAPNELAAICERCTRVEPSARYASARVLADEINRFQTGMAGMAAEEAPASASVYKSLFAAALVAFLAVLAGGVYAYRSAESRRDEALSVIADMKESYEDALAERDGSLKEFQARLNEAETAIERQDAARALAEQAREQAEKALATAKQALIARDTAPAPVAAAVETPPPPVPAEPKPEPAPKPEPKPELKPEPPAEAPKPEPKPEEPQAKPEAPANDFKPSFAAPLPQPAAPEATPAPEPAAEAKPKAKEAGSAARPAPATREEVMAAMPDLLASLTVDAASNQVVIRPGDPKHAASVERLGLRDGDVVTRINRSPVENADQARKVLGTVMNDPGVSLRIVRGGQAGWMRINFSDKKPQEKPEPPDAAEEPAAEPEAPEADEAPPEEAPEQN